MKERGRGYEESRMSKLSLYARGRHQTVCCLKQRRHASESLGRPPISGIGFRSAICFAIDFGEFLRDQVRI